MHPPDELKLYKDMIALKRKSMEVEGCCVAVVLLLDAVGHA